MTRYLPTALVATATAVLWWYLIHRFITALASSPLTQ